MSAPAENDMSAAYWQGEFRIQQEKRLAAEAELERATKIADHWCWTPDEVGRSCGECENCERWERVMGQLTAADALADAVERASSDISYGLDTPAQHERVMERLLKAISAYRTARGQRGGSENG